MNNFLRYFPEYKTGLYLVRHKADRIVLQLPVIFALNVSYKQYTCFFRFLPHNYLFILNYRKTNAGFCANTKPGIRLNYQFSLIIRLIIFCVNFKIALWMCTNRTYFRSFCSYYDMTTVAAFPNFYFALLKNLFCFYVFE